MRKTYQPGNLKGDSDVDESKYNIKIGIKEKRFENVDGLICSGRVQ
jgi:hypothetical protein